MKNREDEMLIGNKCHVCGYIFWANECEESKRETDNTESFLCPSCQKWTHQNMVEVSDPAFEGNLA